MVETITVNGKCIRGHDRVFKVVVVGESGVGKSCLVSSLCDESLSDISSTVGSDIRAVTVHVNKQKIRLMVWDTAGQERFRTLTSSFYRGAHLVLLCFDITKHDTFERLKFWFDELNTSYGASPNVIKILIGTKIDKQAQRTVDRQECIELSAAHECASYLETSAFTGAGVKQAFEAGVKGVLQVEEFNYTLPENVVSISDSVVSISSQKCCYLS